MKMVGIKLSDELHKEFKSFCLMRDTNMSEELRSYIVFCVGEMKRRKKEV